MKKENLLNSIAPTQQNSNHITVFVGGFPSNTTEESLRAYFSDYKSLGLVEIAASKKGGKGFGHMTFADPQEAQRAIRSRHKLNGKMFRVREWLDRTKLANDKEKELKKKIFVGGISKSTNEQDLEEYFSAFGLIEDILVNRSAKTGASKGCAFIMFKNEAVAQALIKDQETNHVIKGKCVDVKECHRKGTKKGSKKGSHPAASPKDPPCSLQVKILEPLELVPEREQVPRERSNGQLEPPSPPNQNQHNQQHHVAPQPSIQICPVISSKPNKKRISKTKRSILKSIPDTNENCYLDNLYFRVTCPRARQSHRQRRLLESRVRSFPQRSYFRLF